MLLIRRYKKIKNNKMKVKSKRIKNKGKEKMPPPLIAPASQSKNKRTKAVLHQTSKIKSSKGKKILPKILIKKGKEKILMNLKSRMVQVNKTLRNSKDSKHPLKNQNRVLPKILIRIVKQAAQDKMASKSKVSLSI